MPLTAGTRLGSYEVVAAIGAGGMGEVYRARDANLGRDVALKILPPEFTGDADWRRRFEREARLLASLNHPNIATIHGFETSGELPFLVMELVPGETLHTRLESGPLPLAEALDVLRQIAAGLEVAHDAGIVHRDLKPHNIRITPDAGVKVLDFGLAKSVKETSAFDSASPTITSPHTRHGEIIGTAPYMSPEQARGRPIDQRTDIWAFGCVMFEVLTGRRAFWGETSSDAVAAILRADPDWTLLSADLPDKVLDLMRRCLQKDPARRLRDARDIRLTIEDVVAEGARPAPVVAPLTSAASRRRPALWAVAGVLLGVAATGLVWWGLSRGDRLSPRPVIRFAIAVDPAALFIGQGPAMAVSPDGTSIAYVLADKGANQLYVRRLHDLEATVLPGTKGAFTPFFSPDGRWVTFFADGKLKKVPIGGGEPVTLANAQVGRGGSWTHDDTVIFAARSEEGSRLQRVSASGGAAELVASSGAVTRDLNLTWPDVLPGGRAILFTGWANAVETSTIMVQSLESGEARVLIKNATFARYIRSGHLLFARFQGTSRALWAVPFDLNRLEVTGQAAPVIESLQVNAGGAAQYAVSGEGTLVYVQPRRRLEKSLVWVNRQGLTAPLSATRRVYRQPRLSPDGRRIAVVVTERDDTDVWIHDIERDTSTRLTFDDGVEGAPIWSPDGEWVAFTSVKEGVASLIRKRADGRGTEERLTAPSPDQVPQSWSPDGKWIAFSQRTLANIDFWLLPLAGARQPQAFLATPYQDRGGVFSPDGRLIAYVSDESERSQVYVRQFPDSGKKWQISNTGGVEPLWSRDGNELFYQNGNRLMAAALSKTPALRAEPPRFLFDARFDEEPHESPGHAAYDVAADGRFLFVESGGQRLPNLSLHVVVNWFDELMRRVPSSHAQR